MYMITYLTKWILNTHLIRHFTIENIQHGLYFSIDFIVEILSIYVAVVIFLLKKTHLFFDTVYLLYYLLGVYILDFLFEFPITLFLGNFKVLEILSTHIFVISGLATLVLSHVVLLHFLE